MPRLSDSATALRSGSGADVVVAAAGGDLVARQQVAGPEDETDPEAEERHRPAGALHLGLAARHVDRRQADGGQHGHGPAEGDAQLGPPGPSGIVLVAPVRVVLAPRHVVGPRLVRVDAEVAGVVAERQLDVLAARDGFGGRPRSGQVGTVGAFGGGHPRFPIMRAANHRMPNPRITPTKPSATGPKWEMPSPPGWPDCAGTARSGRWPTSPGCSSGPG